MRLSCTVLLFVCFLNGASQNIIEWSENYKLQFSDFKGAGTQIGTNLLRIQSGATVDFSFAMSNAEFMFTKNFNSKVSCNFYRNAAAVMAPDSVSAKDMIDLMQYDFNLSELYARKLRKKLYEEKGAFSSVSFFKPIYDKNHEELVKRQTAAATQTDLGRKKEELAALNQEVLKEIATLSDFCKTCKPPKKKK